MKKHLLFTFLCLCMMPMAFAQITDLTIVNPGFEDPDDDVKYKTLSNGDIPGWMTDDTTNDNTGREPGTGLDLTGKYWCYMNGNAGEIYQADIDVIPAAATVYDITMKARLGWVSNVGDILHSRIFLDAYPKGGDPVNRVAIDSFDYEWDAMGSTTLEATFNIPANSAFAGKNLCLGYKLRNEDPTRVNADWGQIDSVSATETILTGIKDSRSATIPFRVYPNPSSTGMFTVSSLMEKQAVIEVYNTAGSRIFTDAFIQNYKLNLSGFGKGLYLMKVKSNDKIGVEKLIIR